MAKNDRNLSKNASSSAKASIIWKQYKCISGLIGYFERKVT